MDKPIIEYIYSLYWVDDDGERHTFYIGRSDSPARRHAEHLRDGDANGSPKQKKIAELLDQGREIHYKILEFGTPEEMDGKEDLWIVNTQGQGNELTNSVSGTSKNWTPECGPVVPWSLDLFHDAKWEKGHIGAKSNEKGTTIKGIEFYRVGKSKLRFFTPSYGSWAVEAFGDLDDKFNKAIKMLTPGTDEHKTLLQGVAQVRRLKG